MVLADIVTSAPIILRVGPGQAPDFGYMCQAVSLLEFSVCAVPWLVHSRCSVGISLGASLSGLISRLSLFLSDPWQVPYLL